MPHRTAEARAAYNKAYRDRNREHLRQQAAEKRASLEYREAQAALFHGWYEKNKDKVRQQSNIWRESNREKARASRAAWRKANPEGHRVAQAARRAKVSAGDFALTEWQSLLYEFDHRCAYCQGQGVMEIEHMKPLSRGGRHVKDNIVPACGPCNRRKHTSTIFEFLGT